MDWAEGGPMPEYQPATAVSSVPRHETGDRAGLSLDSRMPRTVRVFNLRGDLVREYTTTTAGASLRNTAPRAHVVADPRGRYTRRVVIGVR